MVREKLKVYPEKQGISIRGSDWTLWIQRVQTKNNKTMFLAKPLESHYSQKTKQFSYSDLKNPIWLDPLEFDELVKALNNLTEEEES